MGQRVRDANTVTGLEDHRAIGDRELHREVGHVPQVGRHATPPKREPRPSGSARQSPRCGAAARQPATGGADHVHLDLTDRILMSRSHFDDMLAILDSLESRGSRGSNEHLFSSENWVRATLISPPTLPISLVDNPLSRGHTGSDFQYGAWRWPDG